MRARNIKPGFFDNEELAEGGPCAQVLFEALWCIGDREGILENRPQRIKAKAFPYYEPQNFGGKDISELLKFLARKGFIRFYSAGGLALIHITNFKKHQSPHNTERKSILPPLPEDNESLTVNPPLDNGESLVIPPKKNGENSPDSLIHRFSDSNTPPTPSREAVPFQEIINLWNTHAPGMLPRASLTDKRKSKIKAAWKEHPSLEWWQALFSDIGLSDWHSHKDSWKGNSFDWILKNRTEMREKLDAMKGNRNKDGEGNPGASMKHATSCPRCHGGGTYQSGTKPDGSPAFKTCDYEVVNA